MTISSAYHTYQIRIQDSDSSTVFDQKWDKMEERGDLKIDARKQKILDLTVFINELKIKYHEIVLAIETNEALIREKE